MFRKFLFILLVLSLLPVFAGDYDNVLKNNKKVFLYLHTQDCSYCTKFNPIYNKISSIFGTSNCEFIKVDASSKDGVKLMQDLNAFYVPYVVMLDNSQKQAKTISPICLLNYSCTKDAVDKFVN